MYCACKNIAKIKSSEEMSLSKVDSNWWRKLLLLLMLCTLSFPERRKIWGLLQLFIIPRLADTG